ncbi:MAG TPA: anthranilate phosphoribosyltransferase, partial [Flavobacteriia bacterium]|nr:anthranilate phosphoribosyltransferase [Flavobacteriia bacterium]
YGYLYQNTNKNYTILHALDGYDEISLTSNTKVISNETEMELAPGDFGVQQIAQEAIFGGNTIKESAEIFMKVIRGKGTEAQNNVVAANAGMAIATVKKISPVEGFELAKESLLSGKGLEVLKKLQSM